MTRAFLPVSCRRCTRVQLQPLEPGHVPSCRTCGAPSAVLPGATYAEADRVLFERIEESVRRRHISRGDAQRVAWELRDMMRRTQEPEAVLLRVLDFLPTLDFLMPLLRLEAAPSFERHELTRATSMLATIISARLRDLEGCANP